MSDKDRDREQVHGGLHAVGVARRRHEGFGFGDILVLALPLPGSLGAPPPGARPRSSGAPPPCPPLWAGKAPPDPKQPWGWAQRAIFPSPCRSVARNPARRTRGSLKGGLFMCRIRKICIAS